MQSYYWMNLVGVSIGIGLLVLLVKMLMSSFWGPRLKMFYRRPFAMVMLVVVGLFVLIAFMDALSWKDTIPAEKNAPLEAQLPRSILDRVFSALVGTPEYEYREKSYSAPFATTG